MTGAGEWPVVGAEDNPLPSADLPDWQRAHAELLRIAGERAVLDWEESRWLLLAHRSKAHLKMGFGSFVEYVERVLGYSPRTTEDRLRVYRTLETLPQLDSELRRNQLSFSKVRELCRVATEQTEADWIAAARSRTVRQIEQLVSGRRVGDRPSDPEKPEARRHVLRLDLSAETLATFREALAKLRRDSGGPLDDDEALMLMARQVLGGPADAGRANYQIAMTVCERCGQGAQQGKGAEIPVASGIVEMAQCDAQHIAKCRARVESGGECGARARASRESETTRAPHSLESTGRVVHNEVVHNQRVAERLARAVSPHAERASREAERAVHTEGVGTASRHAERSRKRATQTIPPAVRRQVMRRHGACCAVPGCHHAVFVDVHHVDARAEGGTHDPERLVVVCCAHHRALHDGRLSVEGSASTRFVFRRADGSPYGELRKPKAADHAAQAFRALTGMGFKEKEARHGVEAARAHVGADASLERLIRAALVRLSERALGAPSNPALIETGGLGADK